MKRFLHGVSILFIVLFSACQFGESPSATVVPTETPDNLPATIYVDDFGANPFDDQPDSSAIQKALDSSNSGDTIIFTSGINTSGYNGYMIDKTIFLTGMTPKHGLTFTSSDPQNHSLLQATPDLKGYVVRLHARSRVNSQKGIFNIDFGFIDVDGARAERVCMGPDQIQNGVDDNWGSWLQECDIPDDAWCSPGNISFDGGYSGIYVHDFVSQQGECGSGLAFNVKHGTDNTINNVTIDTVGDHVHASGCANTDDDGDYGAWSDGMTIEGSDVTITNNTVINPSDIGIVTFGGKNTTIANNTVKITAGNYGAFAAIAIHPNGNSNASGDRVTDNIIINKGDNICGGLHVGINLGLHVWGGACEMDPLPGTYGVPGCSKEPDPDDAGVCMGGGPCQVYLWIPENETFTFKDNSVTGAHINYLIEGMMATGTFIDENNISLSPQQSDWESARYGCDGRTWGPLDKAAYHPSLPDYIDMRIHCER